MTDPTDEFDFDHWLRTATARRLVVEMYADQAAADELADLSEQYEQAAKAKRPEKVNEVSVLKDLERRWDAAHARWEASKATATLVRLSDPIRTQVEAETPMPKRPAKPTEDSTDDERAEWEAAEATWKAEAPKVVKRRETLALSYGVESLTLGGQTHERKLAIDGTVATPAITADQLEAVFTAPYGPQWRNDLIETFNEVSRLATEPARPTSPRSSSSGRA